MSKWVESAWLTAQFCVSSVYETCANTLFTAFILAYLLINHSLVSTPMTAGSRASKKHCDLLRVWHISHVSSARVNFVSCLDAELLCSCHNKVAAFSKQPQG